MTNLEHHNQLKDLSHYVYGNNKVKKPKNCVSVKTYENKETGFYAEAFFADNKVIIAVRGSDEAKDWSDNNVPMALGKIPPQLEDGRKFITQIQDDFKNHEVVLTGHSLAGSVCQLLSNEFNLEAVTFNAYGTANLLQGDIRYSDKITNYGNKHDIIFTSNLDNQLGKTYVIDAEAPDDYYLTKDKATGNPKNGISKTHFLEDMGKLEDAKEYSTSRLMGSVSYDADMRDIDPYRVLTREDLQNKERPQDYQSLINYQMRQGVGVPTNEEAKNITSSGGLIWVNGYTREDGTDVKGYYRSVRGK